jgi:hypothetical protein
MMNRLLLSITAAIMLFAIGCSTSPDSRTGFLEVRMFDAPDTYEQVNVFVERVEMNRAGSEEGWQVVSEPEQQYDLLELTNGNFEVIADAELETGLYNQIRLILSRDNNNVVIDGEEHSLKIPSGSETGIKLNVNAEILEGIRYVLLLDFDVNRSVVKTGQAPVPGFILQPVIRAISQAESGNIGGSVQSDADALITAYLDGEEITSTYADSETGNFLLVGLEEGSYSVVIEPGSEDYSGTQFDEVEVTIGETTDLGEIELEEVGSE